MNKKNILPVAVLSAICIVVAALLALVNMLTAPVIEEAEHQAVVESLRTVMPGGEFGDPEKIPENAPDTVTAIYKETTGKGYVVTLATQGYASVISITVGVDTEGKITKAVVTAEQESHGKAGMDSYTDRFTGLDAEGVDSTEVFSGATVSSTAMKGAVADALAVLGYGLPSEPDAAPELPKTDDEIKTLAAGYLGGAELVEVTLEDAPDTLKRLYKDAAGERYVAYIVTSTQWVPVETEGFVAIDENGDISDIEMLTWTVGNDVELPPEFVSQFVGRDAYNIGKVELISSATTSSANFMNAVLGAVSYVAPAFPIARCVGIAVLSLAACSVAAAIIIPKVRRKKNERQ